MILTRYPSRACYIDYDMHDVPVTCEHYDINEELITSLQN